VLSLTSFLVRIRSTVGGGEDKLWMGEEMMANALAWVGERGDGKSSPKISNGFEVGFIRGSSMIGGI